MDVYFFCSIFVVVRRKKHCPSFFSAGEHWISIKRCMGVPTKVVSRTNLSTLEILYLVDVLVTNSVNCLETQKTIEENQVSNSML